MLVEGESAKSEVRNARQGMGTAEYPEYAERRENQES